TQRHGNVRGNGLTWPMTSSPPISQPHKYRLVVRNWTPKLPPPFISIAWRLSAQKDKSGMSPPKGALAGIDGPDGNKAQPATALGLGHDCCRRNIKHGLTGG